LRPTNRIHRLLVIAGPSCAGKSTFLRKLENGSYPHLTQRLNVGDPSQLTTVYAKDAVDFDYRAHRNVLFHYALPFLSFRQKTLKGYEQDRRLDILGRADWVTIISLFADSETIHKRIRKRLIKLVFSLIRRPFSPAPQREFRRLLALRGLY